jgi:hypothetical protein
MRCLWIGLIGISVAVMAMAGTLDSQAATEPSTIAPGGGKSPVTGGRPDEQNPRLGPGNRGTGESGRQLIDPAKYGPRRPDQGRSSGRCCLSRGIPTWCGNLTAVK